MWKQWPSKLTMYDKATTKLLSLIFHRLIFSKNTVIYMQQFKRYFAKQSIKTEILNMDIKSQTKYVS